MTNNIDITVLESIKNLEANFVVGKVLDKGMNKHKKPIYIDSIHNWCVLDISTPSQPMKYTIIDLSDLFTVANCLWRYTLYKNRKQGSKNEYVQTVVYDKSTGKSTCTTLSRVVLFGYGSKTRMVADHCRSNKLDNRRSSLEATTHSENLKRAKRRPWEGANIRKRVRVSTPDGEFESLTAAAKFYGVTPQCISRRIKFGMTGFKRVEADNAKAA
ncbi:hypothetical protein LN249_19555 [Vibrio alginolyticus]|nr:hypothetical protein LN249_19555 [Vibrio alginolyticus]